MAKTVVYPSVQPYQMQVLTQPPGGQGAGQPVQYYPVPLGQPGNPQLQGYGQPMVPGLQSTVVGINQPVSTGATGLKCERCGADDAKDGTSALGLLIGIAFFPIGIICCLLMTERRCPRCRSTWRAANSSRRI